MEQFTNAGLSFDLADGGPSDGTAVILLHGFPEDRTSWDGVTPPLQEAGFRTLAPDQRGYSPGAAPTGRHEYRMALLASDVLALADQAGAETFHLVGHDWGAAVAWYLAAHHPDRVRTLSALSVPHPRAFLGSLLRSPQLLRSWYMAYFQLPQVPERMLALQGGKRFVDSLRRTGLNEASAERYAARASEPGGLTGPINWYRGLPNQVREPLPDVTVPTMLIWGDRDRFITRAAIDLCARHVRAPYRLEVLSGVSHWIPEEEAGRTAELLLSHFKAV